jgi:hypothetical protein
MVGDMYTRSKFDPWFANGLYYQLGTNDNHSTRAVKIEFVIDKNW